MVHPTAREALTSIATEVEAALARLDEAHIVERLWARDHTVWGKGPTEVSDRLGWLDVVATMTQHLDELRAFSAELSTAGFADVVLLGMGGSSLGAEVLRTAFGSAPGHPRLHVLDSTVPAWVASTRAAIDPAKTLFLVARKSGGTAEIQAFFHFFWAEVESLVGGHAGDHFVAITDPATALGKLAAERRFRRVFENPPDIGGRFSVLSLFGLVPAAAQGLDLEKFLSRASAMVAASGPGVAAKDNPGARLGAVLGAAALAGRDKATLWTSPGLEAFGLWAEQLIAESTGKEGQGILPIAEEPFAPAAVYSPDRLFLALRLAGGDNSALDAQLEAVEAAGHPVLRFELADAYDLAGELFRWQMATTVAGQLLGVQPFDQPDVESSKRITKALLAEFRQTGTLATLPAGPGFAATLAERKPQYVALMAYLGPSPALEAQVAVFRRGLIETHGIATTFGYAPRLLHSTGQYHKGGPNTGLFVQLLAPKGGADLPIPSEPYGFETLARAQALGDAKALAEAGRVCLRVMWEEGKDLATLLG